ncbi:HAMP domain-containing sensor histidine kinase [Chitinophaga sp. S165]|uniref:HAMP domain-containing sensor histidine kinase n=1 Tax=Chitinophaga sp. S165 TaxID=2135462 RepID=UPI000D70AD46|nr:HAMP domain-containing sensor histidine kinase [Chitinophaga sp. S165]PWV51698.1 signal transduction histidine kinase [Chitinophaga sp. S165]
MPIRLRITSLFTLLVIIILGIVCQSIYYFSAASRLNTLKTRLTNRAITTARLLTHSGMVDPELMHRVDSLTTLALKRKSVQAYKNKSYPIYSYSDIPNDSIRLDNAILRSAKDEEIFYFTDRKKEAVAYFDRNSEGGLIVVCAGEDEDGIRTLEKLGKILSFSFICGTLLSFAGGYFFSRELLRPVGRIANEVNDISAYNLDRRIPVGKSKDEWHQLSTTLNELLDRLKDSFELQRRFISNASHELSTPLTLISSQLEISLQRNRTEEEYRQAMAQVLNDVRHMNSLVQALLKFATASGNAGGLQINLVRIDEILMRLPGEIQSREKEHNVSLHFGAFPEEDERLLVLGNEELLFTAILNIVSNACKYSEDHHADVSLTVTGSGFTITIADNGIGIEEKELERIFLPFYRIRQNAGTKGFGLGLSLAMRIIKLHKGNVKVQSMPGAGTSFTIELPAGQIHQSDPDALFT